MFGYLIGQFLGRSLFGVFNKVGGMGIYYPTFAVWGAIGGGGVFRFLGLYAPDVGDSLKVLFWIVGILFGLTLASVLKKTLMSSERSCGVMLRFCRSVAFLTGFFFVAGRLVGWLHFQLLFAVIGGAVGGWVASNLMTGYLLEEMNRDGYAPVT